MSPNQPSLSAKGNWVLKAELVLESAIDGTSESTNLINEPPKKLPIPIPNVVRARPVTFWLALRVTVKKQ